MASGSAAARNVSEIVLADNDFSHMPEVVAEGRRSINNLQRSASLFLVKTVFTAVLALICIFMPPYPFIPIQMSLISTAVIGIPSFVLALEPNHERIRGNFLANVLARSLPASLAIVCALFAELALGRLLDHSFAEISTVCMMITVVIGLALIYRISRPLTPLRSALLVAMSGLVLLSYTVFGEFFHVVRLAPTWRSSRSCLPRSPSPSLSGRAGSSLPTTSRASFSRASSASSRARTESSASMAQGRS